MKEKKRNKFLLRALKRIAEFKKFHSVSANFLADARDGL